MEFIMELLMEIIFEGAVESITEKKIPVFFRVLIAVILLSFYLGLVGLLMYIGIRDGIGIMIGLAGFILLAVAVVAVRTYKRVRR